MKFLICFVGVEQFSKNGLQHTHTQWSVSNGFLVAYGGNQRSLFAKRGKVNLANRSKSCKSVLPRKGRKRCWLISNPKKRIGNAYTQDGRIANSSERPVAGCFLIRESSLKMLILRTGELQIRPNGAWMGSHGRGFLVAYGEIFFKYT